MKKLFAKLLVEPEPWRRLMAVVVAACGLSAFAVDAPTPAALWLGGFTSADSTQGSWTLKVNGNIVTDPSCIEIASGAQGVLIDRASAGACATIVVKYKDLAYPDATTKGYVIATAKKGTDSNRCGVCVIGTDGTTRGVFNGGYWHDSSKVQTATVLGQSGTFGFYYQPNTGMGTYLYDLEKTVYGSSSLGSSTDGANSIDGFAIGGIRSAATTKSSNVTCSCAVGMKIESIAVFESKLTQEQIAAYTFPNVRSATLTTSTDVTKIITPTGTDYVNLYATDNATLNLDAQVTGSMVTIVVADGKTLTLDGDYAIEATSSIKITGAGEVKLAKASVATCKVTGDGTLELPAAVADSDTERNTTLNASLRQSTWTGTVLLKDKTMVNWYPYIYGNANSIVEVEDCSGYFQKGFGNVEPALKVTGTLTLNDGYGGTRWGFKKLIGSGTISMTKTGMTTPQQLKIGDVSGFTGSLNIANNATMTIGIGEANAYDSTLQQGAITILSGATATVAANQSWTAYNGIRGSGTIILTDKTSTIGSVQTGWTGTVVLKGARDGVDLNTYGNSTSVVRANGTTFWPKNATFNTTFDLVDNGTQAAWTNLYFSPSFAYTFTKLTGSGTFVSSATSVDGSRSDSKYGAFTFNDVSAFTGSFDLAEAGVVIGTGSTSFLSASNTAKGKIIITAGATATVAAGKTWRSGDNTLVIVNGTLKVADTATINMSTVSTTIAGNVVKADTTSESGYTIYTSAKPVATFVGTPETANIVFKHNDVSFDGDYTIEADEDFAFTVTCDEDYKVEVSQPTIGSITGSDGSYTLSGVTGDTTVTATATLRQTCKIGDTIYTTFAKALAAREGGVTGDIIILDKTAALPEGYYNVDGKLVQDTTDAVAQIGSTYYTTLAGAVADAAAGTTITVTAAVPDTAVTIGVGTAEEPLVLSVAGNYLATPQITLADGVTVKMLCTNGGNRAFKFAGATDAATKPTLIIDGAGSTDWGENEGSSLSNLKLVVTNVTKLWLDVAAKLSIDTSVDLEIDAEASVVVDTYDTLSIGNLSGSGSFVYRTGSVSVHATGTKTTFSGTKYGAITINGGTDAAIASSLIKTVGATLDSSWTGTVVYTLENGEISFSDLGNENSTIIFNGVSGYPAGTTACTFAGTAAMVDVGDKAALSITAAQSDRIINLAKVSGSGTIKASHVCDDDGETQSYGVIGNASVYGGNIVASADYGWIIGTVPEGTTAADVAGKIIVEEGATAFIWANKSWTADTVVMNGTLYVISGTTAPTMITTLKDGYIKSADTTIGSTHWTEYTVGTAVAQITDGETTTKYASIDNAVSAATEGQVVKVINNFATSYIDADAENCDVTIDFDYHTAVISGDQSVFMVDSYTSKGITLKNGTIVTSGYGLYVYGAAVTITNTAINAVGTGVAINPVLGSVTIEAGTIIVVASGAALTQSTDCPITVKGGKFKGSTLLTDTSLIETREGYTASWSEADSDGYQTPVWTLDVTPINPTKPTDAYASKEAAQAAIDSGKVAIGASDAVAAVLNETQLATYKKLFKLTVTDDNKIAQVLTADAENTISNEISSVTVAGNLLTAALKKTEGTTATVTTQPGIYYAIEYGDAVTMGKNTEGVIAKDTTTDLTVPTVEGDKAFFRVKASATPIVEVKKTE